MRLTKEMWPFLEHYQDLPPIFYISKSLLSPIQSSFKKLKHLIEEVKPIERTLLFGNVAVAYKWDNRHNVYITILDGDDTHHFRMEILPELSKIEGGAFIRIYGSGQERYFDNVYFKSTLHSYGTWIAFTELFLQYAEIEQKTLPPSRQIWDGLNCLYNNKTKSEITIVDSTWFTTLVKSDGFKVRGHFRLQPCGEGNKSRKLIWVSDFEKEGYTRKAKIESV